MTVSVDVWLRGQDFATTRNIEGVVREPGAWTDDDVRAVLHGMLLAMHQLKHPDDAERTVALRGLSWIVNPYEEGGVLVAVGLRWGRRLPDRSTSISRHSDDHAGASLPPRPQAGRSFARPQRADTCSAGSAVVTGASSRGPSRVLPDRPPSWRQTASPASASRANTYDSEKYPAGYGPERRSKPGVRARTAYDAQLGQRCSFLAAICKSLAVRVSLPRPTLSCPRFLQALRACRQSR